MPTTKVAIETPIAPMMAPKLDGKKIAIISILRAGNGILDGMLAAHCRRRASATSACIAIRIRFEPVEYFYKVPDHMGDRDAIVVDPMLATGNSAVAAIARMKAEPARARSSSCAC